MNDDQIFLANAYLDGELTDEERTIAEADPEVMTEVEELRALQASIRDVDPPSDLVRQAAIAAAMAQFTTSTAGAVGRPPAPAPAPIPFRPRPSYAKYLAVAAGVLGVGVLGVAIANLDTGDDDSADTAQEPASEPAESRLIEDADVFADNGDEAGDDQTTSEMESDQPAMATADEPTEAPAEEPASEEPASEPADEPAAEPATGTDGGVAERPDLVPGQILTTAEELGSFGTGLLAQQQAGTLTTPNDACPIENVLGRAEYQDGAGTIVGVLVAVDEPAGIVLAFDDESCGFLISGPLYAD